MTSDFAGDKAKPKGVAPTFKGAPTTSQDPAGKNMAIECTCNGDPKPVFKWTKDEKEVVDGIRIKQQMSQDGTTFQLKLDIIVCFGVARNIVFQGLILKHVQLSGVC